jgi:hypothetical protein
MLVECIIETPQFLGSEDKYYMLRQIGVLDTETFLFTPYKGGHRVQFQGEEDFERFRINVWHPHQTKSDIAYIFAVISLFLSIIALICSFR